jgi:hypothetical protein
LHDIATPEFAKAEKLKIDVRKRSSDLIFRVSEVGEVRCSTTGFVNSRSPISRNKREISQGVVVGRFPEREIEEPVELSGAEKKRSCVDPDLRVWGGVCIKFGIRA